MKREGNRIRGRFGWIGPLCALSLALWAPLAEAQSSLADGSVAPPEKTMTLRSTQGEVVRKDKGVLEVRTKEELLRFRLDDEKSSSTVPSSISVGDQVKLWYTNESGKLKLQRAGLAKSGIIKKDDSKQKGGTRGEEIIDDRAFFSAQNEAQ